MARLEEHQIQEIINLYSDGMQIKGIREWMGFSSSEWNEGMEKFPNLRTAIQDARLARSDERVQGMYDVAKDENMDVSRAKLIIDTIKWEASKLIPQIYGDRLAIEVKTIDIRDGLKAAEQNVLEGIIERKLLERLEETDEADDTLGV